MMKRLLAVIVGTLLAACGGNVRTTEMIHYDFGNLPAKMPAGSRLPLATVDVQAASWLAGSAMHFRLAYAEPLRRHSYAESRWAAPPTELLEALLRRRIIFTQPDLKGSGCRLQLVIDEFEQRFDDAQKSQMVLETRALLRPLRGAEIVAKRFFQVSKPAVAPTARGGAAGARDAVHALADDLAAWLEDVGRENPAIVERCRT